MFSIYHIREKEVRKKKRKNIKKYTLMLKINAGLLREQTLGITELENYLQDMKRKLRTISGWCNYHAVSLYIER